MVSGLFHALVSKLANTRINEFINARMERQLKDQVSLWQQNTSNVYLFPFRILWIGKVGLSDHQFNNLCLSIACNFSNYNIYCPNLVHPPLSSPPLTLTYSKIFQINIAVPFNMQVIRGVFYVLCEFGANRSICSEVMAFWKSDGRGAQQKRGMYLKSSKPVQNLGQQH